MLLVCAARLKNNQGLCRISCGKVPGYFGTAPYAISRFILRENRRLLLLLLLEAFFRRAGLQGELYILALAVTQDR